MVLSKLRRDHASQCAWCGSIKQNGSLETDRELRTNGNHEAFSVQRIATREKKMRVWAYFIYAQFTRK